jgi:hypothetical protein
MNADDFRHNAAGFAWGVELSLAFSALGGEVPHQILVGITQNIIAVRAVLREIQRLVFKDGDQVGEPVHLLFAIAKFGRVVEIRKARKLFAFASGAMIFLLIWSRCLASPSTPPFP